MGFLLLNSDYGIEASIYLEWVCIGIVVNKQINWSVYQYTSQSIIQNWQGPPYAENSCVVNWEYQPTVDINVPQLWIVGEYVEDAKFTSPFRAKENYK